jgi:hypothetical protein
MSCEYHLADAPAAKRGQTSQRIASATTARTTATISPQRTLPLANWFGCTKELYFFRHRLGTVLGRSLGGAESTR